MDVRLPRLGEGADTGTISTIFVKEGDQVRKDQPVLELESEKAVASIPSPANGTITRLHVKEGDTIKVGQLIMSLIENGAGTSPTQAESVQTAGRSDHATAVVVSAEPGSEEVAAELAAPALPRGVAPPASPSIRKLARELGIDLTLVRGSERGGRIVMSDLKRYVQRLQRGPAAAAGSAPTAPREITAPPAEPVDFAKWGTVTRKSLTTLRRAISTKMTASWTTTPHVTQFDEADVTSLLALTKKYAPKYEKQKGHLTLTCFVLKAVAGVLKKHPIFNASLDETTSEIVYKSYYHIGIAVDTEQGLIVPVIRDADKKSLLELSIELQEIAERTRRRKVGLEEMQGGTFTISNQGGIGSGPFTPIINRPELAILGMGKGAVKPVVRDGKVRAGTMLPLSLSYDHRLIDGADAARFMVDLVQAFENVREADLKI